ncbi:PKD domain-containing protein [Flammeovirga pectinis]|uniref:Endoglucanase n=1 Tax=Flammeovirga pectinis TaxID=2494373 RepID=A0A3S9P078_9BACT|nr:glycoside hydrolase family 48 protein [Flammeovirga pectinis]AZQ61593.1 PKD domain-containing protein [Flammeovirga pectinis]
MKFISKLGVVFLLHLSCLNLYAQQFNYGEALQKSLFFYEAQQSGELPEWNRVSWRDDSALMDGADVGHDLTGGWYDAGDHVKFGFPMAYSVTVLAWGAIEYEDAYAQSGQLPIIKRNLRFVLDYLIKCHTAPNELYGQVGAGGPDHAYWGSSEVMTMDRPAYKIDTSKPGTDLAAETAAAMAASSILFKDNDPAYSTLLLQHAKQLYEFADNYRGVYSEAIPDAAGFYRSFSGYQDELVWGAAWLYRATNETAFLTKAEAEYQLLSNEGQSDEKAYGWGLAWDDKSYGAYILMAELTGKEEYKQDAERHLDYWTDGYNGDRITYSPGGQAHLVTWGSLRHSSNTSFLAFVYSDKITTSKKAKYHDFAVRQINYALGDNPINRSFMVGFGNNPANNPHHRAAHGAWANNLQYKPDDASHILYGALAGGPGTANDQFEDDRGDYIANEVACDYNACFTGALARMYAEYGGSPLANFPIEEIPTRAEIRSVSKFNSNNSTSSTVRVLVQNRTAWPARITDKLKFRYFFDITEAVDAGYSIADYDVELSYAQGNATLDVKAWDASQNIYYAEISLEGEQIAPIGDPAFRRDAQINVKVKSGVPYDTSNDWSALGLDAEAETPRIPVYDNGILVFGEEPGGGNTPSASFTANVTEGYAPLEVSLDASASSDPNGDNLSYTWDLGNGETSTLVAPSVTYTLPGVYTIELTVSDGQNVSSLVSKSIVVNGVVIPELKASFTASLTSGTTPLSVTFNASSSTNNLDTNLSYAWDFGDGTVGSGLSVSHTFTEVGEFTVTLTVTNTDGEADMITSSVTVSEVIESDCTFGTPLSSGIASLVNLKYEHIHVVGNGGPDLSNIRDFTINWDAENNGLYQFSMNTANGSPSWFIDLLGGLTHNLNAASPSITITSSGISGLDGAYWTAKDGDNFVLVSKTAGFTIYFSTSAATPDCGDVIDPEENTAPVAVISTDKNNGNKPLTVNFDGSGSTDADGDALSYLWDFGNGSTKEGVSVSHIFTVVGEYEVMLTVTDTEGASDLKSTTIIVTDKDVPPVEGDCTFGTPQSTSLSGVSTDAFNNIHVLGTGGPDLSNIRDFTMNWDAENNGLYQFSFNTNNGSPSWYIDLLPNVAHSLSVAQPSLTITSSGISGLDGEYWVTTDGDNFVLVSKANGYTIYFSNSSNAPECGTVDPNENQAPTASITTNKLSGKAPLGVTFDASDSEDVDGDTLTFAWDFGDGTSETGVVIPHTYSVVGTYNVSLTVTDTEGASDEAVILITVSEDDIIIDPPTGDNKYIDRFVEMRDIYYDPANGYFSADGSPHHSIETLIVEAPDHGHESTSELYSYWMWLEVMHGRISGDWEPLKEVWRKTEQFIIPSALDQPNNSAYSATNPAAYAAEHPLPSGYPSKLEFGVSVNGDYVSDDLKAAYGTSDIYQMHWLLDNDNFYGYGNRGDGISTPSYINTFQRGEQESVYETVPHPSWESFDWGSAEGGFLPLFTQDASYSEQWRYTSAPDADARAVQVMYWALEYAKEQGANINDLDLDKASKMGDYLRIAMFDKYFKPLGAQSPSATSQTSYDNAHYLMSWYMSWGGSADSSAPWAFRIGSSHCHFGYQNPMAAYALSQIDEMQPISQNGARDWNESLQRQMEFYTWLQSSEGAIAGGATNSWNGDYSAYPVGKSTFYDMAFDVHPVYHDPGSGGWFGWQAWSMERVAEYYYISNDPMAKALIEKWAAWVVDIVVLVGENDFDMPAGLEWTGEPDTWNANNPGDNSELHVEVVSYNHDLGIAASTAKALTYYAAATEKHAVLDTAARDLAREILDRMWVTYLDEKGVASLEERADYTRFFEEEVYIPSSFSGTTATGATIEPGVTFLDIRPQYKDDPEFARLEAAYNAGEVYTQKYHRGWAQIEFALANAEYGFFFGDEDSVESSSLRTATVNALSDTGELSEALTITVSPNPTEHTLQVASNKQLENTVIRVYNLMGKMLYAKEIDAVNSQFMQLSFSHLPSGPYILELTHLSSNEIVRKKIIKK